MKNFVTIGTWLMAALFFIAAVFTFLTAKDDIRVALRWIGIGILATVAAITLGSVEGPEER